MTSTNIPPSGPSGQASVSYPPIPPVPPAGQPVTAVDAAKSQGKLGNKTILIIAVVIVVLVAVIAGAVSLTGSSHGGGTISPPKPSASPAASPSSTASASQSTSAVVPAGSSVSLGHNLSVTPASGWTNQCSNCTDAAVFVSPDQTAEVLFGGQSPSSSNAKTDLNELVQAVTTGSNALFSVFQTSGKVTSQHPSSNPAGFTKDVYLQFQGTQSGGQGTTKVYGIMGVLLNTRSKTEVIQLIQATSIKSLNSNLNGINTMLNSIFES
jgi:hypothetical protein